MAGRGYNVAATVGLAGASKVQGFEDLTIQGVEDLM
jgi:hypothetical protein